MNSNQKLNFHLQPTPIDYFKLEDAYFKSHCNVSKEVITLSANETYIEYPRHLQNLDLEKKETIVFNFPVGKGKTTICYDLIKEYDRLGWYIIVCSPFQKLVNKDLEEIESRIGLPDDGFIMGKPLKVWNYLNLSQGTYYSETANESYAYGCNVHVMTINCLLGNPGDNALEQSIYKSQYIDNLLEATKGKKVVLFIDELHESIHNFEPIFIANLLRWNDRIQKVYVASATFTPATIPAIKAASLLTDKNLHIYELDRYKNTVQANIHLHVTPYPINSYNKQFLSDLDREIRKYQTAGKFINVLTGTRSLSEKISSNSFKNVIQSERKVGKQSGVDTVYLLTSETELEYKKGHNNIGTTFKTGVDIKNSDGVLFIVIPSISNSQHSQHYGIFTDGIPSIVQSVGRLRNGGEIHLFISEPDLLIDQSNTTYPNEIVGKKDYNHHLQNDGYKQLQKEYEEKVNKLNAEILNMEAGINQPKYSSLSIKDKKNEFAIWYPNFHEFLMDKSQRVLVNNYASFGKYLSPYILWACLRDQFQNARLKEILYHQQAINKITIPASNNKSVIQGILKPLNNTINNQTFRSFVNGFSNHLGQNEDENGDKLLNEYVFNEKGVLSNRLMKDQPGFTRDILGEVISIKTGKVVSLSKREYIMACLSDVQQGGVYNKIEIIEAYRQLLELRDKYLNWLNEKIVHKDGKTYLPAKLYAQLPSDIFHEAHKVFSLLKEYDPLVSNKIISVLQNLKDEETDSNRKKICTELDELFILRSDTRKMIEGSQYYELPKDYIQKLENSYQTPLL